MRDPRRHLTEGAQPLRLHHLLLGSLELLESGPQLVKELGVLDGHPRLGGERGREHSVALGKRQHLVVERFRRGEGPAGLALAVDELENANDLALRGLHGHHQHRRGPVADVRVELRIDVER